MKAQIDADVMVLVQAVFGLGKMIYKFADSFYYFLVLVAGNEYLPVTACR